MFCGQNFERVEIVNLITILLRFDYNLCVPVPRTNNYLHRDVVKVRFTPPEEEKTVVAIISAASLKPEGITSFHSNPG